MSDGQVKNSMLVYFSLTRTSYLVTGQVKNFMYLPGGQVNFFRFFYPCKCFSLEFEYFINFMNDRYLHKYCQNVIHDKDFTHKTD